MKIEWSEKTIYMDGDFYDYANPEHNTYRYCLGYKGQNPLVIIGLNPSTADNSKPDPTMKRVIGFTESNGFESFLMINLYPLRTPCPKVLKEKGFDETIHSINLKKIDSYLAKIDNPTILLAFGTQISKINFLKICFKDIAGICKKYNPRWTYLEKTKYGHPKHPLYISGELKLSPFDIESYIKTF